MTLSAFAPAKVNLYLHVGPLGDDGYHPIESWMVFADVGDEVRIEWGSPPYSGLEFAVTGPFAAQIPTDDSNLAIVARDKFLRGVSFDPPFRLTLVKNLPAASGLGGGSSDAAATLKALSLYDDDWSQDDSAKLALEIGSDVPACVRAASLIARGRGERLSAAPRIPRLHAVLANPGVATSTGAVFRTYDDGQPQPLSDEPLPAGFRTVRELAKWLWGRRNDLEAPAIALHPEIGEVLEAMTIAPESLFARMSGSGATCFSLCDDGAAADALATRLARDHPGWWIKACTLS